MQAYNTPYDTFRYDQSLALISQICHRKRRVQQFAEGKMIT